MTKAHARPLSLVVGVLMLQPANRAEPIPQSQAGDGESSAGWDANRLSPSRSARSLVTS